MRALPFCRRLLLACIVMGCVTDVRLRAQDHSPTLSEAEVEKLRELAQDPSSRVMAFMGFLNQRTDEMDKLSAGKRRPGREEDVHDLMQQIAGILEDLDDNLDEYSKHHNDLRKILPKLLAATERWATALRSVPENQEYSVARKLALEALGGVHDSAAQMIGEQTAWFKEHPPAAARMNGSG